VLRVVVAFERPTPSEAVFPKDGNDITNPRFPVGNLIPIRIVGERSKVDSDAVTVFTHTVGNPFCRYCVLAPPAVDGLELGHVRAEIGGYNLGEGDLKCRKRFAVDFDTAGVVVGARSYVTGEVQVDKYDALAHDNVGRSFGSTASNPFPGRSFAAILIEHSPALPHQHQQDRGEQKR
jgi:hypothetical protein